MSIPSTVCHHNIISQTSKYRRSSHGDDNFRGAFRESKIGFSMETSVSKNMENPVPVSGSHTWCGFCCHVLKDSSGCEKFG